MTELNHIKPSPTPPSLEENTFTEHAIAPRLNNSKYGKSPPFRDEQEVQSGSNGQSKATFIRNPKAFPTMMSLEDSRSFQVEKPSPQPAREPQGLPTKHSNDMTLQDMSLVSPNEPVYVSMQRRRKQSKRTSN